MANPSIPGPIVRQPSSPTLKGTRERTRSREKMETAFVDEGHMSKQPSIQIMDRLEHSVDGDQEGSSGDKPRKTKRNSIRIIITRVCSAILIIADCVFDWLQYYQIITTPLDIIPEVKSLLPQRDQPDSYWRLLLRRQSFFFGLTNIPPEGALQQSTESLPPESNTTLFCQSKSDVGEHFMYFTIAGTVLSLIQLANIIFQIYSEVEYLKKKKQVSEDNDGTPKKILDGRTETLYSVLFIEIPQGILLLRYQEACLPSYSKTLKCKRLKRRIWAAVNGGIALLNNAFRYITCSECCEEDVEDDNSTCGCCSVARGKCLDCFSGARGKCVVCSGSSKPKSKKPKKSIDCFSGVRGKFGDCFWTLLKCFCPCLCYFYRYESPILCGICGKKCIVDKCKCSTEPWSYKLSLCGFCNFHYCPLVNPDDPQGGGQKCCDVTSGLCKCSDGTCCDGTIGCCDCSIGKCCGVTGGSSNSSDGKCVVTLGCCELSIGNCCDGSDGTDGTGFCPCFCCSSRYESLMLCGICGKICIIDKGKCSTEPWSYKLSLCGFCNFHYCPLKLFDPDDPQGGGQKCCDVTSGLCKCSDGTCCDGTIGCCECSIGKCCGVTGGSCNSSDGKCAVTLGCCEWSVGNCCDGTDGTCWKCPERKPRKPRQPRTPRKPSDECKCLDGKGCDDPSECCKSSYGKWCGGTGDFRKCSNACSNPCDYEPLTCNVRFALIVNIGYVVLYFYIMLRMFCLLKNIPSSKSSIFG
ncbi:cell death abnormality protein 1-like [Mytilus californianus]|uniref:cell death abnormality protein 1-like n=1 Tax=Mytilus californianus TaxID=6549 RepID=UPI002245EB42|nr:cell death abnormality protein 1-like [Mytilus californianus]